MSKTNILGFTKSNNNVIPAQCEPLTKEIKADIKNAQKALDTIYELIEAGYIPYELRDKLIGSLTINIKNLNESLELAKKSK